MEIELPPSQFSNVTNETESVIDWKNWRESPEWKIFIAGWNAKCEDQSRQALNSKNMGESEYKVFGDIWEQANRKK